MNLLRIREWPLWLHVILLGVVAPVTVFLWIVVYANLVPVWSARGKVFDDLDKVPETKVALVFGTTHKIDGRENLYYRYRIDAAVRLWEAGKVETLIVSGDNRSRYYNEPETMRRSLVDRGVPEDRIVCDYAGLRTLDSVVRAKEIFGTDEVIFISQQFHVRRAIYLADANGIEAYGFAAKDVTGRAAMKTRFREIGARVKMWLDVNFLDTQPRHLGDKEEMPE